MGISRTRVFPAVIVGSGTFTPSPTPTPTPTPGGDVYAVGDVGRTGTIYEGYTLSYVDDFNDTWENRFAVPHKSASSAASISNNKYISLQTYRVGARQPGGQLTIETDTDPYCTGTYDSNRGVPIGADNAKIENSLLTLRARKGTASEIAAYGDATRPLMTSVMMTDMAILGYPDAQGSGDVIFEARYRRPTNGSAPGYHCDFWLRSSAPTTSSSSNEDINHENFDWNYHYAGVTVPSDGGTTGKLTANDPDNMHTYSMLCSKSLSDGMRFYKDGVLDNVGQTSSNLPDQQHRMLFTSHVVSGEYNAAGWDAGGSAAMEIDYIRVWRRTGRSHYKPLVTLPDQNIAAGGSVTITLPSAAVLWGDANVTEYVQQLPGEWNAPGGSQTTTFTNANPFGPGISYNPATRQIVFAPTDGKSGRAIIYMEARTPGSTCQPLVVQFNVGPKITFDKISYTPGTAGSFDVYPLVDCGELVTNGTGRSKTLAFTGLPTGFSYSDVTGRLSWTTAASGNGSATLTATNSIGQTATEAISLNSASVPVANEDAVTTAYVAKMNVSPTQSRRQLLNDFIAGLRADGLLAKLSWLSDLSHSDSQAAYLNAIQPTKSLAVVGGGTFVPGKGYAGDGTAAYLTTSEFITATSPAGVAQPTRDSATIIIYCNQQNGAATSTSQPMVSEFGGAARFQMLVSSSTGGVFRVGDGNVDAIAASATTRTGERIITRVDAATKRAYVNGTKTADLTTASIGAGQGNIVFLKNGTAYGPDRLALVALGVGFTDADVSNWVARRSTYLTAISAA